MQTPQGGQEIVVDDDLAGAGNGRKVSQGNSQKESHPQRG